MNSDVEPQENQRNGRISAAEGFASVSVNPLSPEARRWLLAHFEVVQKRGWFFNLLSGKAACIEVAFVDEGTLHLNEGVSRQKEELKPPVPNKWASAGKRLWTVPTKDLSELVQWIDSCLSSASGISNYRASGWLEGL